jgi:hypothetical protein
VRQDTLGDGVLQDEDPATAPERQPVLYTPWRTSGEEYGDKAGRMARFSSKRDRLSDQLRKTEESLAGVTDSADETDDDAHRIRRGPTWFWEVYLGAATLVLGLESILGRISGTG